MLKAGNEKAGPMKKTSANIQSEFIALGDVHCVMLLYLESKESLW